MPHPLEDAIPNVEALVAMAPEEVAAKVLFTIKRNPDWTRGAGVTQQGYAAGLRGEFGGRAAYEGQRTAEVSLVIREAWAWLEAQGLLIPAADINGQNGWRVLSRRAAAFADERAFEGFRVARLLPREALHPDIAEAVWLDFMRGDFDTAVARAMKRVEVNLREASGAGPDLLGVKLARTAFASEGGPLSDPEAEKGEREAMSSLFAGALGAIKNPQSHRDVNLDDPAEAASLVMFASYLLRVIEARARRRGQ